jgi:competence protein ComEA
MGILSRGVPVVKLSKEEAKAVKFILLVIGLSVIARFTMRDDPIEVEQPGTAGAVSVPATSKKAKTLGPIDPNTATKPELESLPGIGATTAKRIIAARPLRTLDDLAAIIGPKKARAIASRVSLAAARPVEDDPPAYEDPGPSQPERPKGPLSLNRADAKELETLPGVGPALAERILARRRQLRRFTNWQQIDSIAGVGPAMLKKLKESATLQ